MSIYKLHSFDATLRSLKYHQNLNGLLDVAYKVIIERSGGGHFDATVNYSNFEEFEELRFDIASSLRKQGYELSFNEDFEKRLICVVWPRTAISKAA